MASNIDHLIGNCTQGNPNAAKSFLEFREDGIESTFRFIEAGDPTIPEIGDGITYTANLFDSNNVFIGTKDISLVFTKQLGNGDFIANLEETISLHDGQIYTQGTINATAFEQLKAQKVDIIGGTGVYEGVRGKETITQLDPNIFDEASVSLKIN
ncbi:hypothetical protein BZZ01_24485 [Nostocales cyanobacterium HT-58-2]|nr:hypothetical protein BZZ01_24485 [Nostocales cyanobacterium HT-58-2]